MINRRTELKIFCGNASKELAQKIADKLMIPMGKSNVRKFSDGETGAAIGETVRGNDVFVIQSTSNPCNDNLMELLIMIDALKRASAGRITAVMPYYGYARQDRKVQARDPITAKLVADIITTAGADRVLTMDLHAAQIQGFFNIPVDHLLGIPVLAAYYQKKEFDKSKTVVVSPDLGSVTRTRNFAKKLGIPLGIIDKRRPEANKAEVMNVIGDVEGKTVIMLDDMVDTAGTIVNAAEALNKLGATDIYVCATHPILSGGATEKIKHSSITEFVFTDTIPIPQEKMADNIKVLSIANIFAQAIERIYEDQPVSTLFD
jgi:ribose-phosphate pyrophosphokinase